MDRSPSFTELLDWAEGLIPEPRRSQIAALVSQDTETAASLRWIEDFRSAGRLMRLATPSPSSSARLRQLVDERVRPWSPQEYSEGALAFASGGRGTAFGVRGVADPEGPDDELVFATEIGRLRVTALSRAGSDTGVGVRITLEEAAAATLAPTESRVVLTAGERIRRTAVRLSPAEFLADDVPSDVDHIWLVDPRRTVRLSPPSGWPAT